MLRSTIDERLARQLANRHARRPRRARLPRSDQLAERRPRQLQHDRHRLARRRIVQEPDRLTVHRHPHDGRHRATDTPAAAAFSASTSSDTRGCGSSTYQSTSTTPGVSTIAAFTCASQFQPPFGVGTVDLRDQRLEDGRPRAALRPPESSRPAAWPPASSRSRTRLATSWLCSDRSSLGTRFTCRSARCAPRRRK